MFIRNLYIEYYLPFWEANGGPRMSLEEFKLTLSLKILGNTVDMEV